jgi:hypothetical protein
MTGVLLSCGRVEKGVFEEKMDFFALFLGKRLVIQKKAVPLHSQNGNKPIAP